MNARSRGVVAGVSVLASLMALVACASTPLASHQRAASSPSAAAATADPSPEHASASPDEDGFPSAATTGVPASAVLRHVPAELTSGPGWSWNDQDGCVHVDVPGTRIENLDIAGCVEISANDATVASTRITTPGEGWGIGVRNASGAVVTDSTISGGGHELLVGIKDVTGSSDITVLRSDISDWSTGIQMSRGLVEDNYVHDPIAKPGDHVNGFTHNGGRADGSMVIRHNTFLNSLDQADAISLFQDFGPVQNVVIDHNLVAGGSYSIYAGQGDGNAASRNIVVTNNQTSTRYLPNGGAFGPACCFGHDKKNRWLNNTWADGPHKGETIPPPYND